MLLSHFHRGRLPYQLAASFAVGATQPPSCLLGVGGGLLWPSHPKQPSTNLGRLWRPCKTQNEVPSFSPLLSLVEELPSSPAATVKSTLSLDCRCSSLNWDQLVADFQSLSYSDGI